MPVKERGVRSRHASPMQCGSRNGEVAGLHQVFCCRQQKLYTRVPLLLIAAFFVLSMLLLARFVPSDFVVREEVMRGTGADVPVRLASAPSKMEIVPLRVLEQLARGRRNLADFRRRPRSPIRPPRLALVCPDLSPTPEFLLLLTVAKGWQALGYSLELYTLRDGHLRSALESISVPVSLLNGDPVLGFAVDWLRFEGVIAISFEIKSVLESLMLEPFLLVPVVWIVHDDSLSRCLRGYEPDTVKALTKNWKHMFERANVVVFPNYILPTQYRTLDAGNFLVIPGSPVDVWEADRYTSLHQKDEVRHLFGLQTSQLVIGVVGFPLPYSGMWTDLAVALRSVVCYMDIADEFQHTRVLLSVADNCTDAFFETLQSLESHVKLPNGTVKEIGLEDINALLFMSDIVIYYSTGAEPTLPPVLIRSMAFGLPVIAANLNVTKDIQDSEIGFSFSPGDYRGLTEAIARAKSSQETLGPALSLKSKSFARDLLAKNATAQFGELLEALLEFPSEASLPDQVGAIPDALCTWQWEYLRGETTLLGISSNATRSVRLGTSETCIGMIVESRISPNELVEDDSALLKENFMLTRTAEFEEIRIAELNSSIVLSEEEELQEREEQYRKNWEEVNRIVRRSEKEELHERDDGELERSGQPLCIYETYSGRGAWPFLHQNKPLYRGLSLSARDRRSVGDDVDASVRLPLLNDSYYRHILCDYAGLFSVAYRIDRLHKNDWIGFQPWQAAGKKVALSEEAEKILIDRLATGVDGDTVYFWAQAEMNVLPTAERQYNNFWTLCDGMNAGNCRSVFLEAFKKMYALPNSWTDLPPMTSDGSIWSAKHCWVMPTSSFGELVMFVRMFVDALDSLYYTDHHDLGKCALGEAKSEIQHCYCRLLEGVVNVWAYHSARRLIFVNPQTGVMKEVHDMASRRGLMWVKWFSLATLKGMDEDRAEEMDRNGGWSPGDGIWAKTGEVFWPGMMERERLERLKEKMDKKQKNKERIARMRSRYRQKTVGRYVKTE